MRNERIHIDDVHAVAGDAAQQAGDLEVPRGRGSGWSAALSMAIRLLEHVGEHAELGRTLAEHDDASEIVERARRSANDTAKIEHREDVAAPGRHADDRRVRAGKRHELAEVHHGKHEARLDGEALRPTVNPSISSLVAASCATSAGRASVRARASRMSCGLAAGPVMQDGLAEREPRLHSCHLQQPSSGLAVGAGDDRVGRHRDEQTLGGRERAARARTVALARERRGEREVRDDHRAVEVEIARFAARARSRRTDPLVRLEWRASSESPRCL